MAMPTDVKRVTAKEFEAMSSDGGLAELVRGRIVVMNFPTPRHGQICGNIIYLFGNYLDRADLGHLVSNHSAIQTEHEPDTVRGADVAFYSYSRVPRGPLPPGYLSVKPELVFEVRSQTDRWRDVQAKVFEYLDAGVTTVCVIDEPTETAHVFHADEAPRKVSADEELSFPEILGEFRVLVRRFLE